MSELKWNAPYMDRRTWILGELDHLNMSAEETLALLLIDYYNEQQQLITHEMIAQKIGKDADAVDELFSALSAKGYLKIEFREGKLIFDISGVFSSQENIAASILSASTRSLGDKAYGNMLLGIPGGNEELQRALAYLQKIPLFDEFETEFARPLSSSEMQRLSSWMDVYDQQMILYALYEAGVYDKRSLDYIERILAEWKRKGLPPADYEEGRR